jgi:hypothetical protein
MALTSNRAAALKMPTRQLLLGAIQRLDRNSLAPLGSAATLPQRDDVTVPGLIAVVPVR